MANKNDFLDVDAGRDKIPNQQELEKELSDYLSRKYGDRVKIVSPLVFPRGDPAATDDTRSGPDSGGALSFDMLPEELEAYLDGFIVRQDQAKAVLATKICTHFNRIKHTQESTKK